MFKALKTLSIVTFSTVIELLLLETRSVNLGEIGAHFTIVGCRHITGKVCLDGLIALTLLLHYSFFIISVFMSQDTKYSVFLFLVLSLANLCSSWIAKMCMCICLHDRLICDMLAAKKGGLRNHVRMANR